MAAIQTFLPYAVVASHVLFIFLLAAVLARKGWGKPVFLHLGRYALLWGFLLGLAAVGGSLFYSEIVGFEPCVLCWWQRVFLYPQAVIFGIALWMKDRKVFAVSVALTLLAGIIALYHSYVYWGGTSILPCTALGGACSKVYVYEFGYITIPSMSLTVVVYYLFLAWVHRLYERS